MALNIYQIQSLSAAIKNYSHPTGYFNFNTNMHIEYRVLDIIDVAPVNTVLGECLPIK